jgi:hypothetical protein
MTQPLLHAPAQHQRDALERQADRLEIGDRDVAAQRGGATSLPCGLIGIPADVEGISALVERKPAVGGALRKAVEEPVGALEPAAGNRVVSAELEVIGREPGGDSTGAGSIASYAIRTVRPLAGSKGDLRVGEPPAGPAKALQGVRRFPAGERRLEVLARI